ncbi:MAG: 50S ribosomal protein L6 [Bacteroidaceae bacterium]|nr:50S ribosomal protein L6 [Bacteroidaceae bacterium]MBQ6694490.1 50S ribosomal protein L6 [Bacteroidaceae bacterium]
MSRIGKLPISIPAGVNVEISNDNTITVSGPEGKLSQKVDSSIVINKGDNELTFSFSEGRSVAEVSKQEHAYHGLYRALINNMVIGVSTGFTKELELVGVGYRVNEKPGNTLELILGYTHSIYMQLPAEVKITTKSERNKNPLIILKSCDKQLLGMVCAKIRSFRKPEPYKGKGVKFVGEVIRRKSGKSAGAK